MQIKSLKAREILDSRGWPTIEVDLYLEDGNKGRGSVPAGASVGTKEAIDLRDHDLTRYRGKGVLTAIEQLNLIVAPNILRKNFYSQKELDEILIYLDGTENKSKLGANTILAISIAFAKAMAKSNKQYLYEYLNLYPVKNKPYLLPTPMVNLINGGLHADNGLILQEFMIVPTGDSSFSQKLQQAAETFHKLKEILKKDNHSTNIGDEGGFAPELHSTEQALDYIMLAIKESPNIKIAIDCAASTFYNENFYHYYDKQHNFTELTTYYTNLITQYPIISIEDGLAEDDIKGWQHLTSILSNKVQLVGDDVFVTNTKLLKQGVKEHIANAILIKPNQVGTLTETLQAVELAQQNNYNIILSHRSGETEDTTIAHIAVACRAPYIKTGSVSRSERTAKYNELLRIEETIS